MSHSTSVHVATDTLPFTVVEDPSQITELDPMHLLAEQLGFAPLSPRLGGEHGPHQRARPDLATLASADWDVDARTGFMPPEPPVARLTGRYEAWERLLDASQALPLCAPGYDSSPGVVWRNTVDACPVLTLDGLPDIRSLRRAHVVLTFLSNKYAFSGGAKDSEGSPTIPPPISVPLLAVSDRLDIPPVVTYADTVLWNFALRDPALGQVVGNFRILNTFSGTRTEERFYEVPCDMEALGASVLRVMAAILDEAFLGDRKACRRISAYLVQLATLIDRVSDIFPTFLPECDPTIFYHNARPWFHGGRRRFVVDLGDRSRDAVLDFGGPSAGQATLIHALDVFLTVDHTPESEGFEDTFMQRMAVFMPSLHRRFLTHLASHQPSVRDLALRDLDAAGNAGDLARSYDVAISALKRLRETHTKIVVSHIVTPARKAAKLAGMASGPSSRATSRAATPSADGLEGEETDKPLTGTGGSDLVAFLRLTRQKTMDALIAPARAQS